jgi:hypothetical protein
MITTEESKEICKQLEYPYYIYELILDFSSRYIWADMDFYNKLISVKMEPREHKIKMPSFELKKSNNDYVDPCYVNPFMEKLVLFDMLVESHIETFSMVVNFENKVLLK